MDIRKLSLMGIWGGAAIICLAIVWFFAVYAEMMDTMSQLGGDMTGEILSCIYSSPPVCQGAAFMSSGPSYTPVIFWIGVIALIAGVVMRFALKTPASGAAPAGAGSSAAAAGQAPAGDGPLLGFIPPEKYTKTVYILVLVGAACLLLVPPLAIIGFAGFVLAVLGILLFKPRLTALDVNHLSMICVVAVAAAVLFYITAGTFLFLLVGLAEIVLYYIGFNSYRQNRTIHTSNFKEEAQRALKPGNRNPGE